MIPKIRPWVGRTEPVLRGIQSIWFLNTAVRLPCCSGEHQMWPSLHWERWRSSWTEGGVSGTESRMGRDEGLKIRTSQPSLWRIREASKAISFEYDLLRRLP